MAKKRVTKRFDFASQLSAADAAKVASVVASGLASGEVTLHAEEQSAAFSPGANLKVRLEAREDLCPRGGAEGLIRITLRYRRRPAG